MAKSLGIQLWNPWICSRPCLTTKKGQHLMECGVWLYCTLWYIYKKFYIIYYAVKVKIDADHYHTGGIFAFLKFSYSNLALFDKFWFYHDLSFTIAWNISNYLESSDLFFLKLNEKCLPIFNFLGHMILEEKGYISSLLVVIFWEGTICQ